MGRCSTLQMYEALEDTAILPWRRSIWIELVAEMAICMTAKTTKRATNAAVLPEPPSESTLSTKT